MANLAFKNQKDNSSKMALAHSALRRTVGPKKTYSVEDYYGEDEITVSYYDQDENFGEETISRQTLEQFVGDYYCNVIDFNYGGYHEQHTDTTSVSDYLNENMRDVLKDFLNNRRKGERHV